MEDAWDWWARALETPKAIGSPGLPVSVDAPEQGFYRTKFKDREWEPVAIWKDGDVWVALRSGRSVDAMETWNWACRNPITAEAYDRAIRGDGWADADPTVAAMLKPPQPGHNVGDTSDYELLRDQIESAKAGAKAYTKIRDDEHAGMAQSLRARLNELAGTADKAREAAKRPHLEAGKAIDAEWMPLVKDAKAFADALRKSIADYETLKLAERRRLEAERRREEQEREAEEARVREEARAAEEAGRPVALPPAPAPLPPPPPPPETTVKGAYGRAATISTEKVVTSIVDQDALYQYMRDHADLKACLHNLATRALRAGHNPPGIEFEERAVVK